MAPVALEQADAELFLELPQLGAQGGLGDEAGLRGAPEAQLLGEGDDVLELTKGGPVIAQAYFFPKYYSLQEYQRACHASTVRNGEVREKEHPMHLPNSEGQQVPSVLFRLRVGDEWRETSSEQIFVGRRVVVFALPGAYTPTCSTAHLPRYEELYDAFQKAGIDEIYCLSVNDPFVMQAWGEAQGIDRVQLLPDGNGIFTEQLGMLVDKSDLCFGKRSWRYAMVVDNGVIEKMFIEPDKPGDPYEVSDADTVLRHLAPDDAGPEHFTLFTRQGCRHCARAKALLTGHGASYEEIPLGAALTRRSLEAVTGRTTVPQVYHKGEHLGGADELEAWFAARAVAV